jgi:hypothetical protein
MRIHPYFNHIFRQTTSYGRSLAIHLPNLYPCLDFGGNHEATANTETNITTGTTLDFVAHRDELPTSHG